ncbi:hypothetical protein CYY_006068 [Polysphondylium violaceum]|uniref:Poly [ADP-ribose] polymerase n=1 Tax=Polysphondylium violaceum TaxID=133409 RepID=A0A8J4PTG9_9MYCE|nr:hypothetical protein CYY_006068 [Polysphondylium violaceum]
MPPKKKPAAIPTPTPAPTASSTNGSSNTTPSTSPPPTTTTTTATTTTAPTTTPTPPPLQSSNSSGLKKIQWFWAGDSGKGAQQDILVEYDSNLNTEIELQYQQHLMKPKVAKYKVFKVDKQRFINFDDMVQSRYDDNSKSRTVERKEIVPSSTKTVLKPTKVTRNKAKRKKDSDSSSSDSSSSDSSDSDSSSDDDDSDNEDYLPSWYWAGDSNGGPANGGGHQDVWIKYDKTMAKKLEKSFQNNDHELKVDKERFVDFQNMLQRRYDDNSKRRNIKREDAKKSKKKKQTKTASHPPPITLLPPTASLATTPIVVPTTTPTPAPNIVKKKAKKDDGTTITTTTTTSTAAPPPAAPTAAIPTKISLSTILSCPTTWTDVDTMDYKEVDILNHESEFKWMSELFTKTIASNHKGTVTLSPVVFNTLKVTRVVRIQNPILWTRYHARKQKILDDCQQLAPPVQKILTNIPNSPSVDENANECFLFHGLNVSSVTGIAKFGFDPRFCSLEGMFGAGLYFAENSSKSNQYCHAGACTNSGFLAQSCRCSAKDEVCLLVCRVVLGDSLIENVFRGNSPGNFWHGRRTEPKKPDGINIHHSVVGESKANYGPKATLLLREYIVYESSQVYPEYKVYFKRVK